MLLQPGLSIFGISQCLDLQIIDACGIGKLIQWVKTFAFWPGIDLAYLIGFWGFKSNMCVDSYQFMGGSLTGAGHCKELCTGHLQILLYFELGPMTCARYWASLHPKNVWKCDFLSPIKRIPTLFRMYLQEDINKGL